MLQLGKNTYKKSDVVYDLQIQINRFNISKRNNEIVVSIVVATTNVMNPLHVCDYTFVVVVILRCCFLHLKNEFLLVLMVNTMLVVVVVGVLFGYNKLPIKVTSAQIKYIKTTIKRLK